MIYLQNNRGVAAVELALCLVILIPLVCGLMEVGLLFYNKQVITNASREGARAGITGKTDDVIETIVLKYCNREEPEKDKLIDLKTPNGRYELKKEAVTVSGPDAENDLTVRVSYNYDFLFGFVFRTIRILGFTDVTLSAQTIMRME